MRLVAESGPWYTSGVFLGVAGIAAAVVFGVLGMWAAFRAANPRQELAWQVRASVPLLSSKASAEARDAVEIRVDGQVLHSPRVVELYLVNRGRRDISTEAFDQHRPLRVDVGVPIVKMLNQVHTPAGLRPPRITVEGSVAELGPDMLKRGQAAAISLLVNGSAPTVTIPETPFIDIAVRELPGEYREPPRLTAVGMMVVASGMTGVLVLVAFSTGGGASRFAGTALTMAVMAVVAVVEILVLRPMSRVLRQLLLR